MRGKQLGEQRRLAGTRWTADDKRLRSAQSGHGTYPSGNAGINNRLVKLGCDLFHAIRLAFYNRPVQVVLGGNGRLLVELFQNDASTLDDDLVLNLPLSANAYRRTDLMDPVFEIFKCVILLDLDLADDQRFPGVNLLDDTVNHDTRVLDLALLERLECTLDSLRAIERTRQSRVQVDNWDRENERVTNLFARLGHNRCINIRRRQRRFRRCRFHAGKDIKEPFGQDMHPTSQDDEVGLSLEHGARNLAIVVFSRRTGVP